MIECLAAMKGRTTLGSEIVHKIQTLDLFKVFERLLKFKASFQSWMDKTFFLIVPGGFSFRTQIRKNNRDLETYRKS